MTTQTPAAPAATPTPAAPSNADDLTEVLHAYHAAADRLQQSHEKLQSEVTRLRRELASADAQLQRSKRLAALGEMAAGIAHEVRNPLAAILLYAQMIEQDLADDDRHAPAHAQAQTIAEAVRGLDAIVGDVLNFARPLEPDADEPVPLRPLVDRVAAAAQPELDAAGAALHVDLRLDAAPLDAGLVQQALLNLVRNAAQAVAQDENDGPQRDVRLTVAACDEGTRFRVADTGPGIRDADIDRLFNPFFTTRSTGTGLGLAIVHRIADAHGGSVAVWNEPATPEHPGGAVFQFTLPGAAASHAATHPADRADAHRPDEPHA